MFKDNSKILFSGRMNLTDLLDTLKSLDDSVRHLYNVGENHNKKHQGRKFLNVIKCLDYYLII